MAESQKIIKLDVSTEQEYYYLKCKQYDTNSRIYQLIITDRSIPISLMGTELVTAGMIRSDGNYVDTVCEWKDHKLYFTLTEGMLACSGKGTIEFRIYDSDHTSVISTMLVHINIKPSTLPYERMIRSDEFNVLNHLILSAADVKQQMAHIDNLLVQIQEDIASYQSDYHSLSEEAQGLINDLNELISTVRSQEADRVTAETDRTAAEAQRSAAFNNKMSEINTSITEINDKISEADEALSNSNTAVANANQAKIISDETIQRLNDAIDSLDSLHPSILSDTQPEGQEIGGLWFVEAVRN